MEISSNGLHLIELFEGFVDHKYQDPTGVWTIGYGTTLAAGVVDPLPATCTQAEAEGWLKAYVQKAVVPAIEATKAKLNQNQFDALCSFGYNLGAGIFGNSSAIGVDLRDGNLAAASRVMPLYDMAGGKVLPGLKNRRLAEQKLFNTPVAPKPAPKPKTNTGTVHFAGSVELTTGNWVIHRLSSIGEHELTKTYRATVDVDVVPGSKTVVHIKGVA